MLDVPTNATSRFNNEYFLNFDSPFFTIRVLLAGGYPGLEFVQVCQTRHILGQTLCTALILGFDETDRAVIIQS